MIAESLNKFDIWIFEFSCSLDTSLPMEKLELDLMLLHKIAGVKTTKLPT